MDDFKRQSKVKEYRQKKRRYILVFSCIGFVLILGGLVGLSYVHRFQINDVVVSGNIVTESKDVKAVVMETIAGRRFVVFSKKNKFIYPHDLVVDNLKNRFPRFETVDVRERDRIIEVTVTERKGNYLWCGIDPDHAIDPCYFLDYTGVAFSLAPQFSRGVYFRFYSPNIDVVPGIVVFSEKEFSDMNTMIDGIRSLGFEPVSIVKTAFDNEYVTLSDGVRILIDPRDDVMAILETFTSALKDPLLQKKMKTNQSGLDYFDLRFSNKVYYKFKDSL